MGALDEPLASVTQLRADATVQIQLCVPTDQEQFLPPQCTLPLHLPAHAPVPRHGDVIYLDHTSAWGVAMVIHQWMTPSRPRIKVVLEHMPTALLLNTRGFTPTQ
jgi:hypothetical protein